MHIYEKSYFHGRMIILKEIRTDLAIESRNFYLDRNNKKEPDGVITQTIENEIYTVTHVKITTNEASRKIGKPSGCYITIQSPHIKSGLFTEELSIALSEELKKLLPYGKKNPLIFVAGLGNSAVTPDSIGPAVVSSLIVTRHLTGETLNDLSLSPLCALAPGVLGITGIETSEIFSSVTKHIKPDCIIAIDALASGSPSHVGCTIQLSDTGINPGSGVNNRRSALSQENLGVPVIVVGIPTVSDISSVVYTAADKIINSLKIQLSDSEKHSFIENYLSSKKEDLMVTPKNIDALIHRATLILSRGINLAIHQNLDYKSVSDYIS